MVASLKENKFYEMYPTEESICDALVGGVGYIPYKMAKKCIDDIIIVEEEDIKTAVQFLLKKRKDSSRTSRSHRSRSSNEKSPPYV